MTVETERLIIRQYNICDANDLFEILSDKQVMKYIEPPFTKEQTHKFIEKYGLCNPPMVYGAQLKDSGKIVAQVIFHKFDHDSDYEIGWIINREYWGIGLANEITQALIAQGKRQNLKSLVIECDECQQISRHIAEKLGFCYVSKDNDCLTYRLFL